MGVMVMTVRAHDAPDAMYRMLRPAPDGRCRAEDRGPAVCHEEQSRQRGVCVPTAVILRASTSGTGSLIASRG